MLRPASGSVLRPRDCPRDAFLQCPRRAVRTRSCSQHTLVDNREVAVDLAFSLLVQHRIWLDVIILGVFGAHFFQSAIEKPDRFLPKIPINQIRGIEAIADRCGLRVSSSRPIASDCGRCRQGQTEMGCLGAARDEDSTDRDRRH